MIFTDSKGKTWARRLDVDSAIRLRDYARLDVMQFCCDEAYRQFTASDNREAVALVIDAIYAHYLPDLAGLSSQQWIKRLKGIKHTVFQLMLFESINQFFAVPHIVSTNSEMEPRQITPEILWGDVYRLAGEAAISPGSHTYGEIAALADARRKLEWAQTACIRADFRNTFSSKPIHPAELDPTGGLSNTANNQVEVTADNLSIFGFLCR